MSRARLIAGAAAALAAAAVATVTVVATTSGHGRAAGARPAAQVQVVTEPSSPPPQAAVTAAPSATPAATPIVPRITVTVLAVARERLTVYAAPGGRVVRTLARRTVFGSDRTLPVTAQRPGGWLQVQLPVRPNGTVGWVRAASVTTTSTAMSIVVDRHARTLTLFRAGVEVTHYRVAVGTRQTPTPRGVFFVTDKIPTLDPGGPFGPYALGLSGYSNVLTSFDGGDGVIAIHGTNADWSVGQAASHGCIRMHNRDVPRLYRQIVVGTPVIVV